MKTTHDIAKELLALPNVPLVIEGWISQSNREIQVVMTDYEPDKEAILIQRYINPEDERKANDWIREHTVERWINIPLK